MRWGRLPSLPSPLTEVLVTQTGKIEAKNKSILKWKKLKNLNFPPFFGTNPCKNRPFPALSVLYHAPTQHPVTETSKIGQKTRPQKRGENGKNSNFPPFFCPNLDRLGRFRR